MDGSLNDLAFYRLEKAKEDLVRSKREFEISVWQLSDYDELYIASKKVAEEQVQVAEDILNSVEQYLNKIMWLVLKLKYELNSFWYKISDCLILGAFWMEIIRNLYR